ncbi:AMP-binding protein [Methylibium sp.]|uniref:class I adenylate-forming enzyme family protein n=1 Tax=Methylibium sp. TaxID=2067992 RepID=UPI003341201D
MIHTADTELAPAEVLALYPRHCDTVPSLLASRAAAVPEAPAIRFGTSPAWTYAQLAAGVEQLGRGLRARGIGPGARVAHVAPNSDIAVLLFLALAQLGAVFVPLNPTLTDDEWRYQLAHAEVTAIACGEALAPRLEALAAALARPAWRLPLELIGLDADEPDEALQRLQGFSRALPAVEPRPAPLPDDPLVVIYTSGTTGRPKGVVHSHRNFVWSGEVFVGRLHLQPGDRLLTVFPLCHVNALFYSLGGALAAGASFVTTARFSASSFWSLAVDVGATQLNILAALGKILAMRPRSEFDPVHRIRKIYGGPISAEMMQTFQQEFGVPTLIEGYGMSEIPAACSNPFEGPHKIGSIGRAGVHPLQPGSFAELRVLGDDGRDVKTGEIGELAVRTPVMFDGYLREPEQTAAAFRDGWFLTGDLVRRDADDYVYFVSRKKDIIRRRGENIAGAEIDGVLAEHPDIAQVAAIGVPSELGDEEILVAVVARSGRVLSHEEVAAWCRERLAPMKQPRFILLTDSLPHTPTHRIAKHVLRQDLARLSQAREMAPSPAPG